MTTLISHPLPVLAIGVALGCTYIAPRLLIAGLIVACLPDADVVAFKFGIAYHDSFGHRGASHSLLFAAMCGFLASLFHRWFSSSPGKVFVWVSLACASHSLLDALTNGGLGVAWLWPWSDQRYFMPYRPIVVSPFIQGFFGQRALRVISSEALWVWLPCLAVAISGILLRRSLANKAPKN